jgi:hypothetical protein
VIRIAARIALSLAALLTPALPGLVVRHAIGANLADTVEQDDRSDRKQDHEDAIDAAQDTAQNRRAGAQAAPREFNFRINVPLYYNSNAEEVQAGASTALEADPEIELGWARSLTSLPLRLSVRLRADTDRYANLSQADEDEASGSFKASYFDVNDDQVWAPFVSYKGASIYDPTFSPWTETENDFALGFDKLFNLDGTFHRLPAAARSRGAAVWSLGLSAYVQRRLRTPDPDSVALYVVPSVTYIPSNGWNISLFLNTRERWFETSPSMTTSRRDFEVNAILTIACDPSEALFGGGGEQQKRLGSPQIALQVGFERRSSNLADKSWNQCTVGPVLTANWRF